VTTGKSTGQTRFDEAVKAVEGMLRNGGKQDEVADTVLSDEEFEAIQRRHFGRKADRRRAEQTLYFCLNAIAAFPDITTIATLDDCARFQSTAEPLSKNWRHEYSPTAGERLEEQVRAAVGAKDRTKAAELSQQLGAMDEGC
jgi:hypothetical protein